MRALHFGSALVTLAFTGALFGADRTVFGWCDPLQITGTYTDIHFDRERDSLVGAELRLVGADCLRLQAIVQFTQGTGPESGPSAALVGEVILDTSEVPLGTPMPPNCLSEDAAFFRVVLPEGTGYAGTVFGVILRDRLEALYVGSNGIGTRLLLPRGPSYWEP